ncbi:ankyrin repeat-containing domain protein [Phialemonium atrogriseum]|uniref:Ankyrin repeat-containing domain protein n=1 Tax=Phialemonium atrogriseum TaxID=1093897 RepID=A0AAJ0BR50_9PEZI|nr:ankyrin repeat-containing domain protein [Phialemonium atrogriseum]KAK1762512.1 ankyrin repeat-containing domain protein [Phialemonium atrogriseum]
MIADPIDVSYNVSGGLDDASLWDPLPSIDGFLHSTNNSSVSVSDTSSFQSGFFQDSAFTSPSTEQTSPATSTALSSFFGGSSKQDNRHPPPAREQKNLRSRRRSSNPPRNPTSTSRNPPPTQAPHDREPSLDASSSSSSSTTSTNQGWLSTLHIAAQKGHEHILRVLLRQRNVDLDERDSDGRTALIHAVMEDHAGVAAALLAHGARISAVDCERRNALHWAVLYRREAVLRVLLARLGERRAGERDGGVIDAYDEVGWTPLHIAVERGFESGVMMLLQAGANLHSKARKCPYTGNVIE